ncbi:two-component system sensor histidine kinase CreC [Ferrimonas sp. YFM]|uniref:two-component system sensor histidine kinase CreC n=1 Tax=Ferrimonas sp. YFM TaxID=3028878 RepID=UPI002572D39D|nr:two-component system sensor histidine kinase CreC [Ferrimonas sp. YFM]BDY04126.1 sensor histidine kinase [Ferrimonas sp. YFM]
MRRWPKIPLGLRLFLLFLLPVALTGYLVTKSVIQELKPTVRQVTEETLVDVANLLAVLAAEEMSKGELSQSRFAELIAAYGLRQPKARIWEFGKKSISHRIYVTDGTGQVIADSWQQDIGADFSRWNDVYLTLRGQYGARSTALDPDDPLSTVMHVAAPIYQGKEIIGSVTVAKANRSVQPFIDLSKRKVLIWLVLMTTLVLLAGALVSWRINTALSRLEQYAQQMGRGEKATKPSFRMFFEFAALSNALETLRNQLDGKQYVEEYVQTLTHELKSPLSAIRGAGEILQSPLPEAKRLKFAGNIERESTRMQQLVERLLELAKLEAMPQLDQRQTLALGELLEPVIQGASARLEQGQLNLDVDIPDDARLRGDPFLLRQALFNLMDNALEFVPRGGQLQWQATRQPHSWRVSLFNQGPAIPDYALPRLTERFYSLPREHGQKSTGLGLNFVAQVAKLHDAGLIIENVQGGVRVSLDLPTP